LFPPLCRWRRWKFLVNVISIPDWTSLKLFFPAPSKQCAARTTVSKVSSPSDALWVSGHGFFFRWALVDQESLN
jgi:hypothetical protein